MVEKVVVAVPAAFSAGEIVAVEVSAEEYMGKYAADFHEWVKGVVIKMSPISFPHVRILHYLIILLEACADICIKIVSPETVTRNYGDKFVEYEKAGVQEYWIIDPNRTSCHFKLHVPTRWQDELPKTGAVAETVKKMFAEDAV